MTGNINENDDDNDLGYTPVLSKYFPTFAGVATRDDKKRIVKALLILPFYLIAFAIWGIRFFFNTLLTIKDGIDLEFLILSLLGIGLFYVFYKHIGKPLLVAFVKMLHETGKSFTCWVLIPFVIYLILATICTTNFDVLKSNIEPLKDIDKDDFMMYIWLLPPAFVVYLSWDILSSGCLKYEQKEREKFTKEAHAKNVAANSLVSRMQRDRANAAATTSVRPVVPKTNVRTNATVVKPTIQRSIKPTPPTPPSHQ